MKARFLIPPLSIVLFLALLAKPSHAQKQGEETLRNSDDVPNSTVDVEEKKVRKLGGKSTGWGAYGNGFSPMQYADGMCEICSQENKVRPPELLVQYKPGVGKISAFQDEQRATCRNQVFPEETTVFAYNQKYEPVTAGSIFKIGDIGFKMDAETDFEFAGMPGFSCFIHTSCSQPLVAGDQIGPFLVLAGNLCTYSTFQQMSICGDGTLNADLGETCDPPSNTAEAFQFGNDHVVGLCRSDCTYCGDGVVNGNEECDTGVAFMPSADCKACRIPYCGDGTVDIERGEQCDEGSYMPSTTCR